MHGPSRMWLTWLRRRGGRALTGGVALACLGAGVVGPAAAAQLSLTWADTSTNEDGFKVERKTGSTGAYGQLVALAAGTTGYVDGTVATGSTYCYRVLAYNSAGDSAYSNEACATPTGATLQTVTVTKSGTGSGTVASSPSAINCGSTCSASLAYGASLALSATPTPGSTFTGWSGACTGSGNCPLVVDANKSVTASFATTTPTTSTTPPATPQPTYPLTVAKAGNGSGLIASSPAGVSCGATCSGSFPSGQSVTLAAVTTTRSTFAGWSGACTGSGITCTVTMSQAQKVTATFTRNRWRQASP